MRSPRQRITRSYVAARIDDDLLNEIDALARRDRTSRSQALRMLLADGIQARRAS